jgi:hypothetical protein
MVMEESISKIKAFLRGPMGLFFLVSLTYEFVNWSRGTLLLPSDSIHGNWAAILLRVWAAVFDAFGLYILTGLIITLFLGGKAIYVRITRDRG